MVLNLPPSLNTTAQIKIPRANSDCDGPVNKFYETDHKVDSFEEMHFKKCKQCTDMLRNRSLTFFLD